VGEGVAEVLIVSFAFGLALALACRKSFASRTIFNGLLVTISTGIGVEVVERET
jgi:hypothetical protein